MITGNNVQICKILIVEKPLAKGRSNKIECRQLKKKKTKKPPDEKKQLKKSYAFRFYVPK